MPLSQRPPSPVQFINPGFLQSYATWLKSETLPLSPTIGKLTLQPEQTRQSESMQKKSTHTSQVQRTLGACGRAFKQSCATSQHLRHAAVIPLCQRNWMLLCRVKPWKASGPDNITDQVLWERADQLTGIFTDILNTSLSSALVPACLKTTTFIPGPKKSTVICLNHYLHPSSQSALRGCYWGTWKLSFQRIWTRYSLLTAQTTPQMMPSCLLFTFLSPTSTKRTLLSECCLLTSVQHSTQSFSRSL